MALIQCQFRSFLLKQLFTFTAILPQKVKGRPKAGYRTLWLLHGLSDDHSAWTRRTSIERYVEEMDLAVVMPTFNRSFYINHIHGQAWGSFLMDELPGIARSLLPLSARPRDNFAAGNSMGGFGALHWALLHPDQFAGVAMIHGAVDIHDLAQRNKDPLRAKEFTEMFGPADKIPGSDNDLFALSRRVIRAGKKVPPIYQCCGTSDGLFEQNVRFKNHALKLGLDLTWDEGPGEHEWDYVDAAIVRVLKWLEKK